jgi:hypothetical protein
MTKAKRAPILRPATSARVTGRLRGEFDDRVADR